MISSSSSSSRDHTGDIDSQWRNGGPPLHGFLIQQVIQQVIQQIIQLFRSFWVGVTDCCMTFRDQNWSNSTWTDCC